MSLRVKQRQGVAFLDALLWSLSITATEILLEDNRAVGVRAVQQKVDPPLERVFTADVIISGIGALLTYTKLLPTAPQIPYRKEIERFPRGTSNVTVYVGFKDDPSRLGLKGENYWMYDSIDHDEVFESRNALIGGKARHCFLSFSSLKNPLASTHTAEIIAFVDPEPFVQWSSQPVKKRGQEYEHLKGRIADALLGFVDERIPGFRNLVEYVEVSTPLTTGNTTRGILAGPSTGFRGSPSGTGCPGSDFELPSRISSWRGQTPRLPPDRRLAAARRQPGEHAVPLVERRLGEVVGRVGPLRPVRRCPRAA